MLHGKLPLIDAPEECFSLRMLGSDNETVKYY